MFIINIPFVLINIQICPLQTLPTFLLHDTLLSYKWSEDAYCDSREKKFYTRFRKTFIEINVIAYDIKFKE